MQTFESPVDRVKSVTLDLFRHRSGPNIMLGIFVGAFMQWVSPTQLLWVVGTAIAWAASVIVYSIVDELMAYWEEQQRQRDLLPGGPVDGRPRGIE